METLSSAVPEALSSGGNRTSTVASILGRHKLGLLSLAAGSCILFWPSLRGLVGYWLEDPDFSHGFLIPFISLAVIHANRRQLGKLPARMAFPGLLLVLGSLAFYFYGYLSFTNLIQRLGMWGVLVGSTWFLLGPALLRAKPFPFLFLLFAIPPPFFLLSPLRLSLKALATRLSADMLLVTGYPALAEGNVLVLGDHRLEVADACSGIRSLMAIVATAVLFAYLFRTGFWKGLLLTLTAVPITLAVNVLRIVIISVALRSLELDLTHGTAHELVGYAVFGISLTLLYACWRFYDWLFRWGSAPAGGGSPCGKTRQVAGGIEVV